MKCGNEEMYECLQLLFHKILESGRFPMAWKAAVIVPIPKTKSDLDRVENYRGISLLNIVSKCFCGVLHKRIM